MGFDLGKMVANNLGSLVGAGASLAGGMMNATASKTIAREQMKQQKEFAQNGIQWRVEDAKKAGLHPLYAIGAQGASYTPVSQDSSAMGNAVADAGAYLGKAIDGSIDAASRKALEQENLEFTRRMRFNQLEEARERVKGLKLDNEAQMMQMAQRAAGVSNNPARPLSVSTPMGEFGVNNPAQRSHLSKVGGNNASVLAGVNLKPADVVLTSPGRPNQVAGANAETQLLRTENGYQILPSQAFADATDDDILSKIAFNIRHFIGDRVNPPPDLDSSAYPIPDWAPKNARWSFNRAFGEYRLYDGRDWIHRAGGKIYRNRYY